MGLREKSPACSLSAGYQALWYVSLALGLEHNYHLFASPGVASLRFQRLQIHYLYTCLWRPGVTLLCLERGTSPESVASNFPLKKTSRKMWEGGQFSPMLSPCITQKTFNPDLTNRNFPRRAVASGKLAVHQPWTALRVASCGSAARQCRPLGSTDRPRHSTRSRDPTSLMGYSSAEGAGGDVPILSQALPAYAPALAFPFLSHPCSKSLSYFPPCLGSLFQCWDVKSRF